jgi:hypothetical protein
MRSIGAAAALLCVSRILAQPFPPGYVDPVPLLAAAAREIGEADLRCITFSGTGYAAAVGQTFENAVNIDWPRIDSLANYTRTIDWDAGTSIETFDRKPGLSPASWKYGLGWQGGRRREEHRGTLQPGARLREGGPQGVHPALGALHRAGQQPARREGLGGRRAATPAKAPAAAG